MGKIAFVFPGQGAQYVGMGREIAGKSKASGRIFDEASEALNLDMRKMIFESDEETLKITENTQPAIVTASVACSQPLLEAGIRPDYTAGLSLGEYCSHVMSGSLEFGDAVRLVRKRGKYMQASVPLGEGAMAAILGLSREDVLALCREARNVGVVEAVNFNCPGQIAVAGETAAVKEAVKLASEKGAKRALLLNVSAPFHSSLLRPAGEKLARELENVLVKDMAVPVVTNVTGKIISSSAEIKELLIKQVSSPVYWEDCVKAMIRNGVDTFIEIGPGKVLSGFIKKIDKSVRVYNVEDNVSLELTIAAIKG